MEIIARKKKSLIAINAALAVVSVALTALLIFMALAWGADGELILAIILVPFITIRYVVECFRIKFAVSTITYDGHKFDFGNGRIVSPEQILHVVYSKSYITKKSDAWGSLTVLLRDVTIEYKYIDRVEEVCNRILEIKNNAR